MRVLTIRGLDEETTRALKRAAEKKGLSVNGLVVRIIRESLGFDKGKKTTYTDLDHLSGTWTEKEYREFERNTSPFEVIDENLWKP